MKQYLDLMRDVLKNGKQSLDRTGTGTKRVFGRQMRFNLADGFPLLTTKKMHWDSIVHELLWFIHGDTNVKYLRDNGVRIWDEWAGVDGELGSIYGKQWRNWDGIDQLGDVIEQIKRNPTSRRLIVNSWNVGELDDMALPPCHMSYQFFVENGSLSCQLYQRSADVFLGVPFNIASYALLTHIVADLCDLRVGEFIWCGGDVHVYDNHIAQCNLQLTREVLLTPDVGVTITDECLDTFQIETKLYNYRPHDAIRGKVSV